METEIEAWMCAPCRTEVLQHLLRVLPYVGLASTPGMHGRDARLLLDSGCAGSP
jgi:hypothetical protein